jgi:hypothetical protein
MDTVCSKAARSQIAQLEIRRHQNRATPLPASWTEVARRWYQSKKKAPVTSTRA